MRAILNQRLVRTLCKGCAHSKQAKDVLSKEEIEELSIHEEDKVKAHNSAGCDLCNRTGISGRTLLLDAILLTSGPGQRNGIYEAMTKNVNTIPSEEGVMVHTRREGLVDLVLTGMVDPKAALSYLEE